MMHRDFVEKHTRLIVQENGGTKYIENMVVRTILKDYLPGHGRATDFVDKAAKLTRKYLKDLKKKGNG